MKTSLTVLSFLFILNLSLPASVINVPADQPSIQAGINAATNGDTVLVADSTYYENIKFMGKAITVASHFLVDDDTSHISNTIIDGSQPSNPNIGSVVSFSAGEDTNSALCGFTITNGTGTLFYYGYQVRSGGGIYCLNSGASIENNKIINNSVSHNSASGGGISVISTSSIIVHANVKGNEIKNNIINGINESEGGGTFFWNSGGKLIGNVINNNSSVCSNSRAWGGAVFFRSTASIPQPAFVIFIDNQVSNNLASGTDTSPTGYYGALGGGLFVLSTNALISSNIISHNKISGVYNAGGAGIYISNVSIITKINNNIISYNRVLQGTGWGSGLFIDYLCSPSIINNTITFNDATYGGGICSSNSNSVVMNSIIWGNQAPNDPSIHVVSGSINVVHSDIQDTLWPGQGNINLDPLFAPDSIHLSSVSPCLGAGIDKWLIWSTWYYAPDTDFEGDPRPWPANSMPDMGADERPNSGIITVPGDFPTIQAGIDTAMSGDTVLVSQGTYYENINFNGKNIVVGSLTLTTGDTSYISHTVIEGCGENDPIVTFTNGEDSTAVIIGFTIKEIFSMWSANPGIAIYNSSPRLKYLKIEGIRAVRAFGFPQWGAGLAILNSSSVMENLIIRGNQAFSGGFGGNTYGGGIGCSYSNLSMKNVVIKNNWAGSGGGIVCDSSTLNLINVKIINNHAPNQWGIGGGIHSSYSTIYMQNTLVCNNELGGIYSDGASKIRMINSIMWYNNQEIELSGDSNFVTIAYSDIQHELDSMITNNNDTVFWLEGNIGDDPMFVDHANGDYRLQAGSPCIDAGIQDTFLVYNNNQDTLFVPVIAYLGNAPDMGGYEFDPVSSIEIYTEIPKQFVLKQNYPNPFNPSTTIELFIPKTEQVSLKVYNVLGQKVVTLINENLKPGEYKYVWNASAYATGVYYYKIEAGDYIKTKKLILLK